MSSSLAKLLVVSLAGFVAASPIALNERGQNVIIGYRTVSPEQAQRYNKASTLTDDGNRISTQIGKGVYMTPGRGLWPGGPTAWYCVILADSDALSRVTKAWVPKESDGQELWFRGDKVVDDYIKKLGGSWNPAKTLRMSIIDGKGADDVQLLIPPALLISNEGGMGLTASCKEKLEDLPDMSVKFDDWQNVKGNKQ